MLPKLTVVGRTVTLAGAAADGFFRKMFWEHAQVLPFTWCVCVLAADLD